MQNLCPVGYILSTTKGTPPNTKGEQKKDMSYYNDHLKAVAKRQAKQFKMGKSEKDIRKYLKNIGWLPNEVDTIINIAKREI